MCVFYRATLLNSLRQVQLTLDFVEAVGLEVKWHGRVEGEAAHYCNVCEVWQKLLRNLYASSIAKTYVYFLRC